MNTSSFFKHWAISENPFRAEEARHDQVFARLSEDDAAHPDFEKIVGDLLRPSTAIVFGEKGSGKTAIRLRLAERIAAHNQAHPEKKVLLVPYDDLNPFVDRLLERHRISSGSKANDILAVLKQVRLVDHIDSILHLSVSMTCSACLGETQGDKAYTFGSNVSRALAQESADLRRDLLRLQAIYGVDDNSASRLRRLRRRLKFTQSLSRILWTILAAAGWLAPTGLFIAALMSPQIDLRSIWWRVVFFALVGAWAVTVLYVYLWRWWKARRLARRLHRETVTTGRSCESLSRAMATIPESISSCTTLPVSDSDDARYAMLDRLSDVLQSLGITGIVVVVDRVDEPTLINGASDRMRAIVWPLLNNKFLQQERTGIKMMLPIELRHELFRESNTFFQEARLDKQNMVERLSWTGAMLYDICNARLNACREVESESISLADLFQTEVTRQDIIDALDQMRQPRDAFKLVYSCIQEHCSNVTEEQAAWRIPRLVLESVRRKQSERVQEFSRGFRPA